MAITNFPMINKLAGTGAVATTGTYPVGATGRNSGRVIPICNQYGVSLLTSGGGATRPTIGQLFPLGKGALQ